MWLAKLVPIDRKTLHSGRETSTGSSSTVSQIKEQRDAALRAMIAAIAKHDFTNARRYSEEEIRLKRTLKELEATVPAGQSRTA